MSKLEVTPISKPLDVGTRIHWDEEMQSLYYVDVPNSVVYKYDVNTGETTMAKVGNEPLAFMFPVEGSGTKFIAGLGRKFVFVEWDGVSPQVCKVETIIEVEKEKNLADNRLNGGKVDPYGRLWAGTMGPNDSEGNIILGRGSLYSLEKGVLTKHECNIGCSNGLAWNTKEMKMYYIDTVVPAVFQYDFSCTGKLSNKTKVFDFKEKKIEGLPDGLTIDSNGALWVCCIYGSHIIKFDPKDGKILRKIRLPTPQVSEYIAFHFLKTVNPREFSSNFSTILSKIHQTFFALFNQYLFLALFYVPPYEENFLWSVNFFMKKPVCMNGTKKRVTITREVSRLLRPYKLQVTAVTFGGKNLDKMYVTTARIPVKGKIPEEPAGTTYVIYNSGATGNPGDRYKP